MADLWEPYNQQYAVAYAVLSSVVGTSIGPVSWCFHPALSELELVFLGSVDLWCCSAGWPLPPGTRDTLTNRDGQTR